MSALDGAAADRGSPRSSIQSVERALGVLELFNENRPALSAVEIAELTGLNRATAYRFCQTLLGLGYLAEADERRFRPGLKTVTLAQAALSSYELPDLAMPHLRALEQETGETVNMAVLDGTEVVYLARVLSARLITLRLTVGSRLPAYATSLGRAILAHLPEPEVDDILDRSEMTSLTERTITSRRALIAELGRIRKQGFALNDQELSLGLRGVAAPVFGGAGRPIAAINLSLPHPIPEGDIESVLAPKVMSTAGKIGELAIQTGVEIPRS
jgi:PcaR/PcaU/PobR family beta-ketoadipate pathway transcriptional regulator